MNYNEIMDMYTEALLDTNKKREANEVAPLTGNILSREGLGVTVHTVKNLRLPFRQGLILQRLMRL